MVTYLGTAPSPHLLAKLIESQRRAVIAGLLEVVDLRLSPMLFLPPREPRVKSEAEYLADAMAELDREFPADRETD